MLTQRRWNHAKPELCLPERIRARALPTGAGLVTAEALHPQWSIREMESGDWQMEHGQVLVWKPGLQAEALNCLEHIPDNRRDYSAAQSFPQAPL